jgi:hypothetical protein
VPYAKYPAVDIQRNFLKTEKVRTFLLDEINSAQCSSVLPKSLLEKITRGVQIGKSGSVTHRFSALSKVRPFIPWRVVKKLKRFVLLAERVDYFDLALRAYIVSATTRLLSQDARSRSCIARDVE